MDAVVVDVEHGVVGVRLLFIWRRGLGSICKGDDVLAKPTTGAKYSVTHQPSHCWKHCS